MAEEGKVGEASVDIIANIIVPEEQIAAAQEKLGALNKDASPRSETRGSGTKAKADVQIDPAALHAKIAKAIEGGDGFEIFVSVNGSEIREQIQKALSSPFTITINAEGAVSHAVAGLGVAHGAAVATGAPMSRGIPPEELQKMEHRYRDSIEELYNRVADSIKGFHGVAANAGPFDKLAAVMQHFNVSKFEDLLQVDREAKGFPKAIGGALAPSVLMAQGLPEDAAKSLESAVRAFTGTRDDKYSDSEAGVLIARMNKWMETTPVTARPAQADAQQTAQAVVHTLKQEGSLYRAAPTEQATPVTDEMEAARKELRTILSQVPHQPVVQEEFEKYAPDRSGARPPRRSADPEADLRAQSQLGGMRADYATRRMFGSFQPRQINGIGVDIEPLLAAARGEKFHNLFEDKEGGRHRFVPSTEDEVERMRALREQRRPFSMAGFKGQVRNVNPTEAFWKAVADRYDDEIVATLKAEPETKKLVRASITEGGAAKPLVNPKPPRPGMGSGEAGGIVSASGEGFEKGYRAAYRLLETLDQVAEVSADIDGLWAKIDERQGSGKSTERLEETVKRRENRLAQLEARVRDLSEQALPIESTTPAQARILAAAQRARGPEDRTKGDIGLSEEERLKKFVASPVTQGRRGREMVAAGQLPDPERIVEEVLRRSGENTDEGLNAKQRIQAALREVRGELEQGLPDKGPVRKEAERMFGDVYRGFFGEKERVEREPNAPMMVDARETRGGLFTDAQKEADRAATRAEGGTGRGRVAREIGSRLTGAQTNQGRPETEPILNRPTTDIDLRIAQVEGALVKAREEARRQGEQARSAAAEATLKKFGGRVKKTAGAAGGASFGDFEAMSFADAATTARAQQFYQRSLAQRKSGDAGIGALGQELKGLHEVRSEADRLLRVIAEGGGDINQQREAARQVDTRFQPGELPAGALGPELPQSIREQMAARDAQVRSDIEQALETRTAEAARTAATREARGVPTGDETRGTFKRAGGFQVGEAGEESPFAAFNRRESNPPGGPPAPPGSPGSDFEGVSGPIRVIVDNVPLQVAWAGGSPAGTGVSGKDAASIARDKATLSRADVRRMTSEQNMKFVEEFVEKQRDAGKSDTQIKAALTKFGFGGTANLVIDDAGGGGGVGVGPRDINARRARAGLPPIEARSEEFFSEIDQADKRRAELAAQARRAERGIPKRGFTASVTDIFSNIGGFLDEQVAAVSRYQREGQQLSTLLQKGPGISRAAAQAQETFEGSKAALEKAQADRDAAKASGASVRTIREFDRSIKVLSRDVETGGRIHVDAQRKVEEYGVELEAQSKRVKSAERELPGVRGRAAAFGIGFAGAAGAIAVGTIVAQVGQALLQVVSEAVGPAVERLTGFTATTGRVTGGIADETRARGGDIRGATAAALAATGISDIAAQAISPLISQRADVEAGNKALKEQIDLLHTQQNIARDQAQTGKFDRGLSATTGGLFGTSLFGVPSTAELIKNELNAIPAVPTLNGLNLNETATAMSMTEPGSPQMAQLAANAERLTIELSKGETTLKLFNGQAEKGGSALKLVTDAAVSEKSAALAREVGLNELAESFEKSGRGVQGATTGEDIQSFLAAVNRGSTTPSPRLLLEQTERDRLGQVWLQNAQRNLQLSTIQPQGQAIGLAEQGFGTGGRLGTQQTAGAGINLGGLSSSDQKRLNGELGQTQKLYDQINREVDTGIKAAKDFVSAAFPEDDKVGQDFAKSLNLAAGYGREIASIQIGVQTKQAAFQAEQYAYQINIAKRSLADAKGLAGQLTAESKNNLGVLEREQFFLQRRSQLLQLELNQRQINFQRSIAGFTAPGLTGEERAARIQQAKIEADYAQKQLNIQKQLFGLGGRQFTIQASRQVQDLVGQLGLLEKGRVLNVETAVAEKRIQILTKLQEKENKRVETFYNTAITRTNDIITLQAQLVAATGKAITEVTNQAISAFRRTYAAITSTMDPSAGGVDTSTPGSKDSRNPDGKALGAVGTVQGETSLGSIGVMGEAGGEAYAILRAPKNISGMVSPFSGGGQTTIQIIVSGNKFTSEEDEARVMRKITQAVKDAQDRDFALRGLRN